jgi:hypothetical protein
MYWFTRVLILIMMMLPTLLLVRGAISAGEYCLLVGIAMVLVELADINDKLNKQENTNENT